MKTFKHREPWLMALAKEFEQTLFKGETIPLYRVTCGFPSSGGLGKKNRTLGQCFSPECSADGHYEIMISPTIANPIRAADILAHEMTHSIVGNEQGHNGVFKKLALKIGLVGKMTATVAGAVFIERVQPMLEKIGAYPHAVLDLSQRKKQSTRMIKFECPECGYIVRTSQKWADMGAPICGCCEISMDEAPPKTK